MNALDEALAARDPPPGLIHHSDRGVQYASSEYAARLDGRGFQRSMSRPANPIDNAKAESFMKTLKAEEVDGKTYATSKTPEPRSAPSSKPSTTPTASTPPSAINRRLLSKPRSGTLPIATNNP